MGLLMMLLWVLLLAAVVVGVVLLVRALAGRDGGAQRGSSALQILEERYARGEIDREEFEERRRALRGG